MNQKKAKQIKKSIYIEELLSKIKYWKELKLLYINSKDATSIYGKKTEIGYIFDEISKIIRKTEIEVSKLIKELEK